MTLKAQHDKLTAREVATILHALRLMQERGEGSKVCAKDECEHFEELSELDDVEIDALCEKINMDLPVEDSETRYTNHYLCPTDNTLWDDDRSCTCNDRCPVCDAEIEPYATTDNTDGSEAIHSQDVYDRVLAMKS